jgi:phosphoglycerate dehydrogenase-like enzyme
MSKPKVLIFAPREEPPETINALEGMGCEVVVGNRDWQLPRTTHEDAVVDAARDAVALMGTSMRHTPISRRIMQASQRLRIVAKYTVGVDDIDTEAATDLGIMVCHAPTESNCFGVAETTITFMLSLLKKTAERDADARWRGGAPGRISASAAAIRQFPGQTVGSSASAASAPGWRTPRPGARIIAYDPYCAAGISHPQRHRGRLRDAAAAIRRGVVPCRSPRPAMPGERERPMKPHAIVLNTARGKVIDETALANAIASGRRAAGSMPLRRSRFPDLASCGPIR